MCIRDRPRTENGGGNSWKWLRSSPGHARDDSCLTLSVAIVSPSIVNSTVPTPGSVVTKLSEIVSRVYSNLEMEDWPIQTIWAQNCGVPAVPTESLPGDNRAAWPGWMYMAATCDSRHVGSLYLSVTPKFYTKQPV